MADEVTHAVLAERIDNIRSDIAELKEALRYQSRTQVGLAISLLLIGGGAVLTFILTAQSGT